ncbi:MAG: bifunctional precorrin-2 dehydrogenase/sirohydrochlorin ferrochelatase [Bacillota bacterium]|nr:bifunctional precorrin-2 dehydrogenase/sirohydrochlorin ferrochelatase [Bacillota bacterium]
MTLPLFIDVTGWPVLVVGGGEIAFRKGKNLTEAGAVVTVMAPELNSLWDSIPHFHRNERYKDQSLDSYRMVIAATDHRSINEAIAAKCKESGLLCNSASHPQKGNVIIPGTVREGGFTAALSSEGKTPFLTKKLKSDIKQLLSNYDEETITLLGEVRSYIIENHPEDKERLLKKLAQTPLDLIKEKGNYHDITNWLQRE